jgi:hypothetical protein
MVANIKPDESSQTRQNPLVGRFGSGFGRGDHVRIGFSPDPDPDPHLRISSKPGTVANTTTYAFLVASMS